MLARQYTLIADRGGVLSRYRAEKDNEEREEAHGCFFFSSAIITMILFYYPMLRNPRSDDGIEAIKHWALSLNGVKALSSSFSFRHFSYSLFRRYARVINECYSDGSGSMDNIQATGAGHHANVTRDVN